MILITLSNNLDVLKMELPKEEKIYLIGNQEQTLPLSFMSSILNASKEGSDIAFLIVNKVDALNMAFQVGSLLGQLSEGEKLTVICDEKMQKMMEGFQSEQIIFAQELSPVKAKKKKAVKKAAEEVPAENPAPVKEVEAPAKQKAAKEAEAAKPKSAEKKTKGLGKILQTVEKAVPEVTKAAKPSRPTTLLKRAGIEKDLYDIVLSAVEKSSDANIGLPICLSAELVAHEREASLSAALAEKVKPIYQQLKKY